MKPIRWTSECYIGATFANGRGGGLEIGATKCGKRREKHGDRGSRRPAAAGQHACGQPPRGEAVQLSFDFYLIEAMPEVLLDDRA